MADKLPEEFAPTGPKLTRFRMLAPPPIRPHLFADEARFTLRVAALAGATTCAAWFYLLMSGRSVGSYFRPAAALGVLYASRPVWAYAGTRISRAALGALLVGAALVFTCANLLHGWGRHNDWFGWTEMVLSAAMVASAGLPSLGDLCATTLGDAVTVERRATAYAWLDMAQAIGALLGIAVAALGSWRFEVVWGVVIVAAIVGLPALRDRGTPRSAWPLAAYGSTLRTPLTRNLVADALVVGALAMGFLHLGPLPVRDGAPLLLPSGPHWLGAVAALAGMIVAAQVDRWTPNALTVPRVAAVVAFVGWYLALWPIGAFAIGLMLTAIPAAVARGAGEMERPIASSLAWSALVLGAALGAAI